MTNTARIAKNTLMLYFRQILILLVSLYTVRVVLNTLGAEDYGIYNVVAGVVTMFGFLSGAMAAASQRYFSWALGRGDTEELSRVFRMTVTVYALIALLVAVLAETLGLWMLETRLVIPAERMTAARWVYQFSIVTIIFSVMTAPYMSLILSHERMEVYAAASVLEAVLKLVIVFVLYANIGDALIVYGALTLIVTALNTGIYRRYCRRHFAESAFKLYWNTALFKELLGFTGWFFFSTCSGTVRDQVVTVLFNVFFGPAVNAAQGIAQRISSVSQTFAQNFSAAARPQIVKTYAAKDYAQTAQLVHHSCKTAYFLTLLIAVPVLFNADSILRLWLTEVPAHTVRFTQLVLISALAESLSLTMSSANQATGKVKWYCLCLGGVTLLTIPVIYVFLKTGFTPESVYVVLIAARWVLVAVRMCFLHNIPGFSVTVFVKKVVLRVLAATLCAFACVWCIARFVPVWTQAVYLRLFIQAALQVLCTGIAIVAVGFSRHERQTLIHILQTKLGLHKKGAIMHRTIELTDIRTQGYSIIYTITDNSGLRLLQKQTVEARIDFHHAEAFGFSLETLPRSVLAIPATLYLLPVTYFYDVELVVPVIDAMLYESLERIYVAYQKLFAPLQGSGKVRVCQTGGV